MTAESDVAVVTGAARGLGTVIAARLHGHGLPALILTDASALTQGQPAISGTKR